MASTSDPGIACWAFRRSHTCSGKDRKAKGGGDILARMDDEREFPSGSDDCRGTSDGVWGGYGVSRVVQAACASPGETPGVLNNNSRS